MMSRLHLRAGPMRDLFALIYNISKDGIHTYRASRDQIAEWLGCSERHVVEIINVLLESGYINRTKKAVNGGHAIFEYTTNYEDLLRRAYDGEDIRPVSMKRRARQISQPEKKGGETSPFFTTEKKGGENDTKRVVKVPKKGGETSPTKGYNNNTESIVSSNTPARTREEDENTEFYKIFFFRNAADPAAETRRFVGWYQSRGWLAKDGTRYDTLEKRAGLAMAWELKTGDSRLSKTPATDKYFAFLGRLYELAGSGGGIEPKALLDPRGGYSVEEGRFIWKCSGEVQSWFEGLDRNTARALKGKYIGAQVDLYFDVIAA